LGFGHVPGSELQIMRDGLLAGFFIMQVQLLSSLPMVVHQAFIQIKQHLLTTMHLT
jgi:hypothetical protein